MSDRPIAVGDLVQVVRPSGCPSCGCRALGRTFLVCAITTYSGGSYCNHCGRNLSDDVYTAAEDDSRRSYGLFRLKRIPPLSELEGERTEETLKQPHKEPA